MDESERVGDLLEAYTRGDPGAFDQLVTLIEQAVEEPAGAGSIRTDDMSAEDIAYAIADWVDANC